MSAASPATAEHSRAELRLRSIAWALGAGFSALTLGLVRIAGAVTVLLILGFLLLMARREKRRPKLKEAEHVA